jgi:hypothetical protein
MDFIEFGNSNYRIFPAGTVNEERIVDALKKRGYGKVRKGGQPDGSWIEGESGLAVYETVGEDIHGLAFTSNSHIAADLVIEALRVARPLMSFRKEMMSRPE